MKIGLLGFFPTYGDDNFEYISLLDDKTLLENDMILIDFEALFRCTNFNDDFFDKGNLLPEDFSSLKSKLEQRKKEIEIFLETGRNIFVFCSNSNNLNCLSMDECKSISLKTILPIKISSQTLRGNQIDLKNKKIDSFFKKYEKYFEYNSVYSNASNILMTIKNTDKVVSFYEKIGKGHIIFLPYLSFNHENSNLAKEVEKNYINDLFSFNNYINEDNNKLPEYSKKYLLVGEEELSDEIKKILTKIKKLEKELEEKNEKLKISQKDKLLFIGSGIPLEQVVVNCFRSIGFLIKKYDSNSVDEDIVIEYDGKIAVVEVKGVSGSATEKHTAQLVKWKTEYFIENDIFPKGILVVNAFNNKELDDRQEYFPNQMLKYASHEEQCLLTTIQLYNISIYIKENPDEKEKIIDKIYNTKGLFEGFDEWNMYIKKNNEQNGDRVV